MSPYCGPFSVGFNFWMVVAPLLMVAMVVFEARSYRIFLKSLYIYRTHNDKATLILSGLFTLLVTTMVVAESSDGIVQYFHNGLEKYESPFWSYVGLAFATIVVFIVYWVALFFVGKVAAYAKLGYLCEKKRQLGITRRRQEMIQRMKPFVLPENHFAERSKKKENPRV
ncbi:hypothetical protein IJJ36_03750 [Candidatus Saccharibacteria bacterium]|nr:hypothetical protein [Candidatus Saccharibacteria bacterium]